MTEFGTDAGFNRQQLVALDFVPEISPEELSREQLALLSRDSWKDIESANPALFINTDEKGYGRMFNGKNWDFIGNVHLAPTSENHYPAMVIRSGEYHKNRVDIMSLLDNMRTQIDAGGRIYILEEPGEDKDLEKRLRILKDNGYDEGKITFGDSFTIWEAAKPNDTELEKNRELSRPNLEFQTNYEIRIPQEIRHSALMAQRPGGEVLYIDQDDPDMATIIDTQTWQPALKKGEVERLVVSKIVGRHIGAIIYHTPPRTPEKAYENELANAASLLGRSSKKEEGIITEQHLGALFIMEDKGKDGIKKWREQSMNNIGLVMRIGNREETEKLKIIETDQYFITSGRREKDNSPVNLLQSRAGPYFKGEINAAVEHLKNQGYEVDATRLLNEAQRSNIPPETIGRIKDSGNLTIREQATGSITENTNRGTFISKASTDDYPNASSEDTRKIDPKKYVPQPGDVKELEVTCGDCGEHLKERYFAKTGERAMLLIKQVECDSNTHRRGRKVISNDFVRSLGKFKY